jgi:hypothetical protein
MLIHTMVHWPEIIQDSFWQYAIQMAVDLHSSTPTQSGLTSLEIFIGSKGSNNTELPSFWLSYH